jgi:hypothetical protein
VVVSFLPTSLSVWSALLVFGLLWAAAILLFIAYEEPVNMRIRNRFHSQDRSVGMSATLFRPS